MWRTQHQKQPKPLMMTMEKLHLDQAINILSWRIQNTLDFLSTAFSSLVISILSSPGLTEHDTIVLKHRLVHQQKGWTSGSPFPQGDLVSAEGNPLLGLLSWYDDWYPIKTFVHKLMTQQSLPTPSDPASISLTLRLPSNRRSVKDNEWTRRPESVDRRG